LASTHIFYQFAIETAGTWHEMSIELTQEIGRRITTTTEETQQTTFLFQRLSMAPQRGMRFLSTIDRQLINISARLTAASIITE